MLNMKMTKNRKGFSLAEMVIVIAIIVILAGASAVGVVAWVQNANKTKEKLEAENGDNFEVSALAEVASAVPSAPSYVIPKETAETPAEEETTTVKQEDPTTTAKQHEDPTTTAKQQEDPTTTAKQQQEETTTAAPKPAGGSIQSGVISSSTQTGPQTIEAQNGAVVSLGFDEAAKNANKITVVYTYTGSPITAVDNWGHLGSGAPSISISNGKITITFNVSNMQPWQKQNMLSNSMHFKSNGGTTTVQISSVSMT